MLRGRAALLCVCVCVCVSLAHAYYVRYLNVTASTLLENRRLLLRYVRCFASDGPCPPQARDIKKLLPELLVSDCSACDVKLRQVYERCTQLLKYTYPTKWSTMMAFRQNPNAL